jgi:hypothetical protein
MGGRRAGDVRLRRCSLSLKNGSLRQWYKGLTRLTYASSKKWEHLHAALALHFAYYDFCRIHRSLRVTPAMESGVTDHVWTLRELLTDQ